jgi:hypothetical protein
MVDEFLWINVFLAFIVGGIWIALITVMGDRFGSKIGGFIGGIPSTVVVSLFFIGLVQTPQIASQATTVLPLIFGFSCLFMVLYAILSRKGFVIALISSLGMWLMLSGIVAILRVESFILSLVAYVIILLFSYYMLENYLKIPSFMKASIQPNLYQILLRALFGGLMIAFAVFMSKIGGPIFGGIFAAFPAVFTSTLIISYKTRGIEFSRAMTKSLTITALLAVVVYVSIVRFSYLAHGLVLGTLIAFLTSMVSAYFIYFLFQKRLK